MQVLSEISGAKKNFRAIPFFSDEKGRISAGLIEKESNGLNGKHVFICGPDAMMKSLKRQFLELGLPRSQVHTEEFAML